MKRLKTLALGLLIVGLLIGGFYTYIAIQLKKATVDVTVGIREALLEKRNNKVTIYDKDSLKSILQKPPYSIFLDEFKNRDSIIITITRSEDE
jgi:fibronectin type 3 domain-containing protein